jgi:methionyl-tRNA formyltransferase
MSIVVFTSSFPRHRYLVNLLSKNFKKVIYICEKKPYIRSKITKKKKEYFKIVRKTEKKIFGRIILKKNVKKISFNYGKLKLHQLSKYKNFKSAKKFLIFGSSYIKSELFEFLKKKNCLNIHMGVMPYYRGTDCNFWAIYDKQFSKVGATLMLLSKKIDDGKVFSIFRMNGVEKNNLFDYSMMACKFCLEKFVKLITKNNIKPIKIKKNKLLRFSKKKDFDDKAITKFNFLYKKCLKKI